MFIDEVEITLIAGKGGRGRVSFFPGKKSGPDGGDGGSGGNLFIKTSKHISNLNAFINKQIISAENGSDGGKNNRTGANGKDLIIELPTSSQLLDLDTKESIEIDFEDTILICKGGKGGRGNAFFKSASNTTPKFAEKGEVGQKRHFKISMRLIANFGLIGLPNAGKSSLLNSLTNAKAQVAYYPFTTLQPNLGSLEGKIIADIPGLIEGASGGKGLGVGFLKHIEKVNLLIHCISAESENVSGDYQIVLNELEKFNPILSKKNQIILLTKSDLYSKEIINSKIARLKKLQEKVLPVSIYNLQSLGKLRNYLLIID